MSQSPPQAIPAATRPRARALGVLASRLPSGPLNAITDVHGVLVGHTTLIAGQGALRPGHGPVRTGVTVILPHDGLLFREKVRAAVHTINGFGKPFGFEQVRELGVIESPIALTNTLNVGRVADALIQHAIDQNPDIGIRTGSVNVIVGETNDGYLNDLQGRHIGAGHVLQAIANASAGPVTEGAVGAGTGTRCMGWKGGIGTASRQLPAQAGGFTLGALVQSNFGRAEELVMGGLPVGQFIRPPAGAPRPDDGSIMVVLATNAPLTTNTLQRLCVRAAAGLARTGSVYAPGSGDFVIAFSTAGRVMHQAKGLTALGGVVNDEDSLHWLFQAVVESVEEAVLNSLCQAETMVGRDEHVCYGLPVDQVAALAHDQVPKPKVGYNGI